MHTGYCDWHEEISVCKRLADIKTSACMTACDAQTATDAASSAKPWAGDAIAALARGGLGSFRLAHAESAAQAALLSDMPAAVRPDACQPHNMRRQAADIMAGVSAGLTLPAAFALADQGLVGLLLQVRWPVLGSAERVLPAAGGNGSMHGTGD